MLFNSLVFFLFFAGTYAIYRVLPLRGQNWLLLGASYYFYGYWDPRFLGLIVFSTAIDYLAARKVGRHRSAARYDAARAWLALSVGLNLAVLGLFKYFDFFSASFAALLGQLGFEAHPVILELALPVGISFYTFQTMSYTIDVYRRRMDPVLDPVAFALFVAFFPQLMAGPIERAKKLLPQLQRPRVLDTYGLRQGSWLVFWGLFQKVYVSDNLLEYTRWGFSPGAAESALEVYMLMAASAARVYCDFSGYSDMARGLARLLGIELSKNFDRPFAASDPAEFWRRWHMSLTQWLTDYLYLPLRRRLLRSGVARSHAIAISTFSTLVLMGLWHGAGSGYVAWGAFWGVVLVGQHYLTSGRATKRKVARPLLARAIGSLLVVHLFAFSLLFITGPLDVGLELMALLVSGARTASVMPSNLWSVLYFGWPVLFVHLVPSKTALPIGRRAPVFARAVACCVMGVLLLVSGSTAGNEFVYFQF